MKTFTLYLRLIDNRDEDFNKSFSFEATDEPEAIHLAKKWARYHSFSQSDVKVLPSTLDEAIYLIHNEYVD